MKNELTPSNTTKAEVSLEWSHSGFLPCKCGCPDRYSYWLELDDGTTRHIVECALCDACVMIVATDAVHEGDPVKESMAELARQQWNEDNKQLTAVKL